MQRVPFVIIKILGTGGQYWIGGNNLYLEGTDSLMAILSDGIELANNVFYGAWRG
jgi:hypothetical protein